MTLAKIRTDEKGNLYTEKILQCCFKGALTSSSGKTAATVTVFYQSLLALYVNKDKLFIDFMEN